MAVYTMWHYFYAMISDLLLSEIFILLCFQNSELISLADESRGLKDELDVLRHTAEQVVKYEAQIESYKKKMGRKYLLVDDLLTLLQPVNTPDNLCKQIGHRSGPVFCTTWFCLIC